MAFWLFRSALADTVTFTGSTIPLRDCRIEGIQGGQVSYRDSHGQRQRRGVDEIRALGFDGLPDLDSAEAELAEEAHDTGLMKMLEALLRADTDVQRLWIHVRLAQVHELRNEYVESAGHAAAVMMANEDASWKVLEPRCEVKEPAYPAAAESLEALKSALRKIKNADLKNALTRMLQKVQPLHDRLAQSYDGPPILTGSTVSGIPKLEILKGKAVAATQKAPVQSPTPAAPQKPTPVAGPVAPKPPSAIEAPSHDPESPQAIDAMLAEKNWSAALALCQRLAPHPGQRDLGHFLFQYGLALANTNRKSDAAVMFTRSVVLFPDESDATQCLIQVAIIYRDEYKKPDVAKRLLNQALEQANVNGEDSTAMLARELLGSF